MRRFVGIALSLLIGTAGSAFGAPPQDNGVDSTRVNDAVQKGAEFLKSQRSVVDERDQAAQGMHIPYWDGELVLLAMLHAGLTENDPDVSELLERMLKNQLWDTYSVALQAMVLEKLDAEKYRPRIVQCAQFLVDNQCKNGQWSYRASSFAVDVMTHVKQSKDTVTGSGEKGAQPSSSPQAKPKNRQEIRVVKKRDGPATGDNSNSQYAALGVRACHDAGIVFPSTVITLARKWWVNSQRNDRKLKKDTQAGKGWCYEVLSKCPAGDHESYGGMTAGGVGSMAIYDYILGKDPRKDPVIVDGLQWLANTYTVTEHPGGTEIYPNNKTWMRLYYLYGVERACMLVGTEKLGTCDWYREGTKMLLEQQSPEGDWNVDNKIFDTCFAIFFLCRSTKPLVDVATMDTRKR